jgi:hypothetical protein
MNPCSQAHLSSVPSAVAPAAGAKVEAFLSAVASAKEEAEEEIVSNRA